VDAQPTRGVLRITRRTEHRRDGSNRSADGYLALRHRIGSPVLCAIHQRHRQAEDCAQTRRQAVPVAVPPPARRYRLVAELLQVHGPPACEFLRGGLAIRDLLLARCLRLPQVADLHHRSRRHIPDVDIITPGGPVVLQPLGPHRLTIHPHRQLPQVAEGRGGDEVRRLAFGPAQRDEPEAEPRRRAERVSVHIEILGSLTEGDGRALSHRHADRRIPAGLGPAPHDAPMAGVWEACGAQTFGLDLAEDLQVLSDAAVLAEARVVPFHAPAQQVLEECISCLAVHGHHTAQHPAALVPRHPPAPPRVIHRLVEEGRVEVIIRLWIGGVEPQHLVQRGQRECQRLVAVAPALRVFCEHPPVVEQEVLARRRTGAAEHRPGEVAHAVAGVQVVLAPLVHPVDVWKQTRVLRLLVQQQHPRTDVEVPRVVDPRAALAAPAVEELARDWLHPGGAALALTLHPGAVLHQELGVLAELVQRIRPACRDGSQHAVGDERVPEHRRPGLHEYSLQPLTPAGRHQPAARGGGLDLPRRRIAVNFWYPRQVVHPRHRREQVPALGPQPLEDKPVGVRTVRQLP